MTTASLRSRERTEPISLADPAVRAAWLAGLRSHFEDLVIAALDATDAPANRDLGRREARRIIGKSADALARALDAAGAPPVAEADRAVCLRPGPERL